MMKKIIFRALSLAIAMLLVTAAPFIKSSCDAPRVFSFTGVHPVYSEEKKSGEPIVTFIELGSVRCGPCRMMQPIVEQVKKDYAGQVNVVFYDVWTPEGKPVGEQYNIRIIPTQIFLDKDGKEYFRHEGFFPRENIIEVLKRGGVK